MGFFDFLKRKQPSKAMPPPDKEEPTHHYVLAHYALRQMALDKPLQYLAVLASPDADRFIASLFESVCEQLKQPPDFGADAVIAHHVHIKEYPCAIIEMPQPKDTTEAYFTALVAFAKLNDKAPPDPENVSARYFTLELGFSLDGTPRTVLAEWSKDRHINYGDGPKPTVEAFAGSIEGLIK